MSRFFGLVGTIGCVLATVAMLAYAQQPTLRQAQPDSVLNANSDGSGTVLMRAKLSSSQKVVEGLMAGDFSMILKGGEDLLKISDSQNWKRGDDQVVGHYRSELRRAALKLIVQAKAENLDGAAYTYMHTMTTCINCHQYSRDVLRIAGTHGDGPVVPIPVTEHENAARQLGSILR